MTFRIPEFASFNGSTEFVQAATQRLGIMHNLCCIGAAKLFHLTCSNNQSWQSKEVTEILLQRSDQAHELHHRARGYFWFCSKLPLLKQVRGKGTGFCP